MINYRFLNYKHNTSFEQDLANNLIHDDAIAFIQDECYIWARGQKYMCNGVGVSTIEDNTLTFVDGNGNNVFTITQQDGTITITNSSGEQISATYVLKSDFDDAMSDVAKKEQLDNYATLQQFNELSNGKQDKLTAGEGITITNNQISAVVRVDNALSDTSSNPVQNKAIVAALANKADAAALNDYVTSNDFNSAIAAKQNTLTAGRGIDITDNTISTTLDTDVYVITNKMPPDNPNPNKIYLYEVRNQDGTYRYIQYRLRDGVWVSFDSVTPTIDLTGYLTSQEAQETYQPIGDYLTSSSLVNYATNDSVNAVLQQLNDYALADWVRNTFQLKGEYALKDYVDNTFVRKSEVYTPTQGNEASQAGEGDEPIINPGSGTGTIVVSNIVVDSSLSFVSSNAVENRIITQALQQKANVSDIQSTYATKQEIALKADKEELHDYVLAEDVTDLLAGKQDTLTPGRGIQIMDNVISSTLDTDVFVITDNLPIVNQDGNKIYLLETVDNGEYTYTEWRWRNNEWVQVGERAPEIDLSGYLRTDTAASTYQVKGTYITPTDLVPYFKHTDALTLRNTIQVWAGDEFQPIGDYQPAGDYVTPSDVYTPYDGNVQESNQPITDHTLPNTMVTLSQTQYYYLVNNDLINEGTYYFTYEDEGSSTWQFGGTFPITLTY